MNKLPRALTSTPTPSGPNASILQIKSRSPPWLTSRTISSRTTQSLLPKAQGHKIAFHPFLRANALSSKRTFGKMIQGTDIWALRRTRRSGTNHWIILKSNPRAGSARRLSSRRNLTLRPSWRQTMSRRRSATSNIRSQETRHRQCCLAINKRIYWSGSIRTYFLRRIKYWRNCRIRYLLGIHQDLWGNIWR